MKRTIFLDTEYSAPNCLLTGFMAVTQGTKILGEYGFSLRHDLYTVDPEAIEVNKIDIQEHHKTALYATQIEAEIRQFIKTHSTYYDTSEPLGSYKTDKLTAVGHGIRGDIAKVKENFTACKWDTYVSRNVIDTIDLSRAAELWGIIKPDDLKLGTLAKYFEIPHDAHIAKSDVYANIQLFDKLREVRW